MEQPMINSQLLVAIVVLVLIAAGAVGWFVFFRDAETATPAASQLEVGEEERTSGFGSELVELSGGAQSRNLGENVSEVNPFAEGGANPFRKVYKNPFE